MQSLELIRFRVMEDRMKPFLEGRPAVDKALKSLEGFLGSELVEVSAEVWLLIVRWESHDAVLAAQQITRNMSIISDWINTANQVLAFETTNVRYVSD